MHYENYILCTTKVYIIFITAKNSEISLLQEVRNKRDWGSEPYIIFLGQHYVIK